MSDKSYIGLSLLVGFSLALIVVVARRRNGPSLPGWREPLVAAVIFMFGFSLVRIFGGLVVGDAALPSWSTPAKELWMFVFGVSFIVEPKPDTAFLSSNGRLVLGLIFIAIGTVAFIDDATHFLHGA